MGHRKGDWSFKKPTHMGRATTFSLFKKKEPVRFQATQECLFTAKNGHQCLADQSQHRMLDETKRFAISRNGDVVVFVLY